MMKRLALVILAAMTAGAPAALAAHGQIDDSLLRTYPFQILQDVTVEVEWFGIGGPGGSTGLGTGTPTPDDCLDVDEYPGTQYVKYAYPSVAIQTTVEETELLPGASVPAPAEVVAACTLARELYLGQEEGYEYASDQQSIGYGAAKASVESTVNSNGFFDDALVGDPSTTRAMLCTAEYLGATRVGTEGRAQTPNGAILVADGSTVCTDVTADYIAFYTENPTAQWDPGTFNRDGTASVHTQSLGAVADGLFISCVRFSVVDAQANAAGFFEDYSWFFVDNADTSPVAAFWADPLANSDGIAPAIDCSTVGIDLDA